MDVFRLHLFLFSRFDSGHHVRNTLENEYLVDFDFRFTISILFGHALILTGKKNSTLRRRREDGQDRPRQSRGR